MQMEPFLDDDMVKVLETFIQDDGWSEDEDSAVDLPPANAWQEDLNRLAAPPPPPPSSPFDPTVFERVASSPVAVKVIDLCTPSPPMVIQPPATSIPKHSVRMLLDSRTPLQAIDPNLIVPAYPKKPIHKKKPAQSYIHGYIPEKYIHIPRLPFVLRVGFVCWMITAVVGSRMTLGLTLIQHQVKNCVNRLKVKVFKLVSECCRLEGEWKLDSSKAPVEMNLDARHLVSPCFMVEITRTRGQYIYYRTTQHAVDWYRRYGDKFAHYDDQSQKFKAFHGFFTAQKLNGQAEGDARYCKAIAELSHLEEGLVFLHQQPFGSFPFPNNK